MGGGGARTLLGPLPPPSTFVHRPTDIKRSCTRVSLFSPLFTHFLLISSTSIAFEDPEKVGVM